MHSPPPSKKTREKVPAPCVEFKVSPRVANLVNPEGMLVSRTREQILAQVWKPRSLRGDRPISCKELFQSSLREKATGGFLPKTNGFVDTIVQAYSRHHDLIIRPDDVWMAILSQLNLYINANAESLRSFFVKHEGQKELTVRYEGVTRYTMDFSIMARDFASLLKENINDPTLYSVILPNFSTSTINDKTICSAMMMSIMQAYFTYRCDLYCGITAVKLLGMKEDYESIMTRLDKINEMGVEAQAFVALLRPIIKQFIATFDAVNAGQEPNLDFWDKICHVKPRGSGSSYIGGWLAAFCVWNADGKWQGPSAVLNAFSGSESSEVDGRAKIDQQDRPSFDVSIYGFIDMDHIPVGFTEVPVKVDDNGVELECMLISGHVGARIRDSNLQEDKVKDTLQTEPHWFFFEIQ